MNAIFGDAIDAVNKTASDPTFGGMADVTGFGNTRGMGDPGAPGSSAVGTPAVTTAMGPPSPSNAMGTDVTYGGVGGAGIAGGMPTAADFGPSAANAPNVSTAALGPPGSVGPGGIGSDANIGVSTYGDMSDVGGFGNTRGVGDPGARGGSAVGATAPAKAAIQAISIANQSPNPTATIQSIVSQVAKTMSPSEFSGFLQQLSNYGYGYDEGESQGGGPDEAGEPMQPRDPSGTYFDYMRQNRQNQGLGL
jgi:hypothetical protein